jgi:hypothetical protein
MQFFYVDTDAVTGLSADSPYLADAVGRVLPARVRTTHTRANDQLVKGTNK